MGTGAELAVPELLAGGEAVAGGLTAAELGAAGAGLGAGIEGAAATAGLTDAALGAAGAGLGAGIESAAAAAGPTDAALGAAGAGLTSGIEGAAGAAGPTAGGTGGLAAAGDAAAATAAGAGAAGALPSAAVESTGLGGLGGAGLSPAEALTGAEAGAAAAGPSLPFGTGGDATGAATSAGTGAAESEYEKELLDKVRAAQAASAAGGGTAAAAPAASIGQKLLNQITGNPLTAAALGLNVAGQLNAQKSGKTTAAQLQKLSQPAQDISTTLLDQYKTGQINPSTSFDIQQWKNQQIASTKNYYAKAGIPDSSAAQSAIANIEAKAVAMEDQARQGLLSSGLQAAGVAAGPASAAITAQAQQDQQLSQASGSALQSLMLLQAMQSGGMAPGKTG